MLKKTTMALVLLLLSSCDSTNKVGTDGYSFGDKQYEKNEVTIKVVAYKTQNDLLDVAKTKGISSPDVVAFSVLRPPFDVCTVHMIDPAVRYEPEFVGHEFLHCVYGQWHTSNDDRS
jgi:hypothetical protein